MKLRQGQHGLVNENRQTRESLKDKMHTQKWDKVMDSYGKVNQILTFLLSEPQKKIIDGQI